MKILLSNQQYTAAKALKKLWDRNLSRKVKSALEQLQKIGLHFGYIKPVPTHQRATRRVPRLLQESSFFQYNQQQEVQKGGTHES